MNEKKSSKIQEYWIKLEHNREYEKPLEVALIRAYFFIPLEDPDNPASYYKLHNAKKEIAIPIFTSCENFDGYFRGRNVPFINHYGKDFFRGGMLDSNTSIVVDGNLTPQVILPPQALPRLHKAANNIEFVDIKGVKIWSEMNNANNSEEMGKTLSELNLPSHIILYYFELLKRSTLTGFVEMTTEVLVIDTIGASDQSPQLIEQLTEGISKRLGKNITIWNLETINDHMKNSIKTRHRPIWPKVS